jgi:glucose/mannose-6-phosphate isomerase
MNLTEDYTKLDPSGVEKALTLFPEQIKITYSQAINAFTPEVKFDSVIVSGMGGSSNAGKIIQGIIEDSYDKQFAVFNDYGLPAWVNNKTLVIANSYSGNTEETLSAVKRAKEIGSPIIGIATGGKIGEMITNGEIQGAVINPEETNPTTYPKSGLGVSLGGLLGVLTSVGVIKFTKEELKASLNELIEIRKSWNAKEMASFLHGGLPVLFSGRPLLGALNAGRNAMCEISRNFTEFYEFPEVNHVLVEAVGKPKSALQKKYLFFESNFNHERVKLSYKITKDIFSDQKLMTNSYKLMTSTVLAQSLELAHYCAWVGFYLSILDDTDPGPEPWILKLKSALAQPVH